MKRAIHALSFVLLLVGAGTADLLVNGGFEQPLDVGWTDTAVYTLGLFRIDRQDTLGQQTGYAARVYKYMPGYASLSQTMAMPGPDVALTFDARLRIGGGSSTCWPVASLWVRYLDAGGLELGNTRFYLHDQYATWAKSDTVSLINVPDNGVWHNYSLDVAQELATNLPGINPSSVAKLTVDLFAFDNGWCHDGWAEVCADNVSLVTTGVEEGRPVAINGVGLAAFPNPFTGSTSIRCPPLLPVSSPLELYDAAGNLVLALPAGGSRTLDGSGLKAGVYVLKAGNHSLRLVKAAR
jgi:hypothetical protein